MNINKTYNKLLWVLKELYRNKEWELYSIGNKKESPRTRWGFCRGIQDEVIIISFVFKRKKKVESPEEIYKFGIERYKRNHCDKEDNKYS